MRKAFSFLCSSLLLCTTLCAATKTPTPAPEEEPAYDADLFKKDTPVFSVHGSFLFWRIQEGALDFATKMQKPSAPGTVFAQGKLHSATFNGDPGFRIATSYFRAPHYWELWLQYTRFTSRGSNHVYAPSSAGRYLTSTWGNGPFAGPLVEATSHIHFNYNVGDFFSDRVFIPNPHLKIRLIGGGTTAWMSQNWSVHYINTANDASHLRNHWSYVAGGLRLGTTIDWYCGWDIYLSSMATCASLLGSYKNQSYQTVDSIGNLPIRNTHYQDIRPTFTVQAVAGLSWQKSFCGTRVELFGGYELNSWWNLQEVYRSTDGLNTAGNNTIMSSSLLALQGLTTRLTMDF